MKQHKILTDFNGSQDGLDHHAFKAGTVAVLSDGLAAIAVSEGWAEPFVEIEERETKVVTPEETKPAPSGRKRK